MWIILPLKALSPVKTRLAPMLSPGQRKGLMMAMIRDVLQVLTNCELVEGVLLVSRDQDIPEMAGECGVQVLELEEDRDLNSAVLAATGYLAKKGIDRCMVLHGDIPLVNDIDLTRLIRESERCSVALLASRDGQGSNAVVTTLPARIPFLYGNGSYDRFREAAQRAGLEALTLESADMALDIDTAADLSTLCKRYRDDTRYCDSHTRRFLRELGFLTDTKKVLERALAGVLPDEFESRALALFEDTSELVSCAATLRDREHGTLISYSRKVFIPLTHLCRDVCHYCTFARVPRKVSNPYMSVKEVLEIARQGAAMGCREALLTLGEKPELRYKAAREALAELGFKTTLQYVAHVAKAIFEETGLLPHINAGCMDRDEIAQLRKYAPSMGIMLESVSARLCEKGMPHHGSPDKIPARRLETIALAGEVKVPFTTGILIGIGETRLERIESLLALRDLHSTYGHIQEIIIQNFRAKPGTLMADADEPNEEDLRWTIAVARIIFGAQMNIQAPPNLVPGSLEPIIEAGINDLGGISPLTLDHVNPEAPWPQLDTLAEELDDMGRCLQQRLTLYPEFARDAKTWVSEQVLPAVLSLADGQGYAREDDWLTGQTIHAPAILLKRIKDSDNTRRRVSSLTVLLQRLKSGDTDSLTADDIARLFTARGDDFSAICHAADHLRKEVNGNAVSFVSNRNINYTNICYFKCKFCAFSKGKVAKDLRDKPYDLGLDEIQRRTLEAHNLGATEVCLQGGIHPRYTGQHYIDICEAIKDVLPDMHIHAFSPLEVWQGAETLGIPLIDFLHRLRQAGLGSLPGTAAEILHDDVREELCADKINTQQWLEVMETAHAVGLSSTATIMFGHVDRYEHWGHHLLAVRKLQSRTRGFTEFVPLPFVAHMAPVYRRGQSRRGPTFREAVLMHAVARLILHPHITNIQASWVKMGLEGVQACLEAGVNDIGGTLINETITRSAGASHGQLVDEAHMRQIATGVGRPLWQRSTLYKYIPPEKGKRQVYKQIPMR